MPRAARPLPTLLRPLRRTRSSFTTLFNYLSQCKPLLQCGVPWKKSKFSLQWPEKMLSRGDYSTLKRQAPDSGFVANKLSSSSSSRRSGKRFA